MVPSQKLDICLLILSELIIIYNQSYIDVRFNMELVCNFNSTVTFIKIGMSNNKN